MLIYLLLASEVNVYFNKSVDTTYMDAVPAKGNMALDSLLCERISNAQYSIDFCFYNFGRERIADSLISAKQRGVRIRVITEHDNWYTPSIQKLIEAGIPVIDDSTLMHSNSGSLMHNKFGIFDARDTIAENSWVWTGSYNITDYCTINNSNDVIEIQNDQLAQAYTLEFNEMWGDTGDASPDTGHFSTQKTGDPAWQFTINDEPWGLYFSPHDSVRLSIINAINTAQHSIYFCIFCFSGCAQQAGQSLCDAMKLKRDSGYVTVRGVFDATYWNQWYSKSLDMRGDSVWKDTLHDTLLNNPWTPPAEVYADSISKAKFLHHKYMIIDAEYPDSDPIVITGSANWSNAGFNKNDENILVIHSYNIANQYLQHFVARYEEAGGTYVEPGVEEITKSELRNPKLKAYPNPFIQSTAISFQLSANNHQLLTPKYCIYDITGRLINEVNTNVIGEDLAPGIYFLKVKGYKPLKLIKLH